MSDNPLMPGHRFPRDQFLKLLEGAYAARSFRFGRQAALAWLAIYPGDLDVNLMQAKMVLGEGKENQVISMLDRILRFDPEHADTHRLMAAVTDGADQARWKNSVTSLVALREGKPGGEGVLPWGQLVRQAHQELDRCSYDAAWAAMQQVLEMGEPAPVAKIMHLRLAQATEDAVTLNKLAEQYYKTNKDCLQYNLYLADSLMKLSNEGEAVRLLHKSMSMDASGKVPARLWGRKNPYQSIWPEKLSLKLDLAIPAEVANKMGWTWQLGEMSSEPLEHPDAVMASEAIASKAAFVQGEESPYGDNPISLHSTLEETGQTMPPKTEAPLDPTAKQVQSELERIARKIKKSAITRADGRYPAYVIFTTRSGLHAQYGPQTSQMIEKEARKFLAAIRRRTGWEAMIFFADDQEQCANLGIPPALDPTAWKLKLSVADLDQALAKKGLMIGCMLILGGSSVVPFHELPNPTDDFDEKVLSDNPYGTLDANYFVPEWPVGRLPGARGSDAGPLLQQIRLLTEHHNKKAPAGLVKGFFETVLEAIRNLPVFRKEKEIPNFGYTAAVWRRSTLAAFRPAGNPHLVRVSPPTVSASVPMDKMMAPELAYFNLHGLADTAEWYGQRDPSEPLLGPDYPIALAAKDIGKVKHAPMVIFSEACYGGYIEDKSEDESLALKFLSIGTLALVGSTTVSYGTISAPLSAADLLGNQFLLQIKEGRSAGEAFMISKVELVREMVKRQGYLDAEDQKTLLSFVLYGDPLVGLGGVQKRARNVARFKRHPDIRVIGEKRVHEDAEPVSERVIRQVKDAVASYLPGAEMAEVKINEEVAANKAAKGGGVPLYSDRYVVMLSKQIPYSRTVHRHYARATVQNGKIVKLVVSR